MRPVRQDHPHPADDDYFLPDFCAVQSVLSLILVGELLVLVLELGNSGTPNFDWMHFGLASVYVQWLILLSAALLCRLRPALERLPLAWAGAASYGLVVVLAVGVSIAAHQLMSRQGWWQFNPWLVVRDVLMVALLAGIVLRYFYLQAQARWRRQAALSARIEALQARIRPHFLFNSMNTIASLIAIDAERAEQAVEDLSELFRASLASSDRQSTLGQELDLCRRYVAIEQLRLGERLAVTWQVQQLPESAPLPLLTLQPLVENAIYHGIQPRPDGGRVTVEGVFRDGRIRIVVRNPLPDLMPGQPPYKGHGLAVDNIRLRLQGFYGDSASLRLCETDTEFLAELDYPYSGT